MSVDVDLVTIRAGSETARPLFLVHPVGGSAIAYRELAKHLVVTQPVYAFENATAFQPARTQYPTVVEMAERYIRDVSSVQPLGPYTLGGFSMGGVVAFEMARQLREAGHAIDAVIMIDTPARIRAPIDSAHEPGTARVLTMAQITSSRTRAFELSAEEVERVPPPERLDYLMGVLRRQGILPPHVPAARIVESLRGLMNNEDAQRRYQPGMFDGPLFLIRALEPSPELQAETGPVYDDPSFGWQSVSRQPVEIVWVPGQHLRLLHAPHVEGVGAEIQRRLDRRLG